MVCVFRVSRWGQRGYLLFKSGVNDGIFVALAVLFLVRTEQRLIRNDALRSIRVLRSAAHVIDLHQLTKDPLGTLGPVLAATPHSPIRDLPTAEMERYLQYCIELLSIIGALAALHAQDVRDPTVVEAVGDIESLTLNLSAKIWNKISGSRLTTSPSDGRPTVTKTPGRHRHRPA
jgi:hypothetical protein